MKKLILFLSILLFSCPGFTQIKVACVGNSITYGAFIKKREQNAYPQQLQEILGYDWKIRNFGCNSATMLKSGDVPYWEVKQFADAKDFLPDVVIIKLGTNDSKPQNWRHKNAFIGDYLRMIDSFRKQESQPVVWICKAVPVFPEQWGIKDSVVREEINPRVEYIARKAGARPGRE